MDPLHPLFLITVLSYSFPHSFHTIAKKQILPPFFYCKGLSLPGFSPRYTQETLGPYIHKVSHWGLVARTRNRQLSPDVRGRWLCRTGAADYSKRCWVCWECECFCGCNSKKRYGDLKEMFQEMSPIGSHGPADVGTPFLLPAAAAH